MDSKLSVSGEENNKSNVRNNTTKSRLQAVAERFLPLTYVGVAERVLGVRQGARTALRQPVNVQAAEDEQQADQVLAQRPHRLQT